MKRWDNEGGRALGFQCQFVSTELYFNWICGRSSLFIGLNQVERDVVQQEGQPHLSPKLELLSATDLDQTVNTIGSTRSKLRACLIPNPDYCYSDPNADCDGDRPRFNHFDRINFYERMPGFDYLDVDADGVSNRDDVAPL